MLPQDVLLRWFSDECPGTSKCRTLFMLGEDAGSCLRIISNEGNRYNCALMGYVLQSHVRALVVLDAAGRVRARSLIRLLIRSDTLTPVIFCDPMFFTTDYSEELQLNLLKQARVFEPFSPLAPPLHPLCTPSCTLCTVSLYCLSLRLLHPLCVLSSAPLLCALYEPSMRHM